MKNNLTVILINGKAGSGKNFLADLIKLKNDKKNVDIIGNADAVKKIAKEFFMWDGVKDENGRQLLIDVSNTAYAYDEFFWEKKSEEKIIHGYDDIVVIPDFRYAKTYEYYKKEGYNVITIHIKMDKDINDINNEVKNDATEQKQEVDFDFEIENEYGNIDKLEGFVRENLLF